MPFNRETPGFDPTTEQPEAKRPAEPTLADAKKYLVEHLHEPGLEDAHLVLKWGPAEALPYFETRCDDLRNAGSTDLYRVRELTHVIDKETRSGGFKTDEHGVALLLMDFAGEKFRVAPKTDSLEYQEARAEHDAILTDVRNFERFGTIEPVLGLVEKAVAALNDKIEAKSKEPNKNPKDERARLNALRGLAEERKKYRRARTFLMDKYFQK